MAIQNDDWDIRKAWFYTEVGGNGDFYLNICQEGRDKTITKHSIRATTSGSRYPSEIILAIANLHRTLEKYGLNDPELNRELEFKALIKPTLTQPNNA